jgi:hypothetical protein
MATKPTPNNAPNNAEREKGKPNVFVFDCSSGEPVLKSGHRGRDADTKRR